MTESLLSISNVSLYGEQVSDMTYKAKSGEPKLYFVRVFGFRFEGNFYGLSAPVIMLLEGTGKEPDELTPENVKRSLSGAIKEWVCDKSDHSARLDELTGTIEDILLEVELGAEDAVMVGGGRVSGGKVTGGKVTGGRINRNNGK